MNSYTKRGGAARRCFCVICKKPEGGGNQPPLGVRVLNSQNTATRRAVRRGQSGVGDVTDWALVSVTAGRLASVDAVWFIGVCLTMADATARRGHIAEAQRKQPGK